jgi:hypothetical protein
MTLQVQAPPRTCARSPLSRAWHADDRSHANPGPPPTGATVTLPGTAASVPAARQVVNRGLGGCPRAGDLAVAITELAANALAWSPAGQGGTFTARLRTAPRWARIEATDPGPAQPPRAPLPPAAGNGRDHGRHQRYVMRFLADQARSAVVPRLGYCARERATAMAGGGGVHRSFVLSVARAMRKLEAEGPVIICVPGSRPQGAQMSARLTPAPRNVPAA